MPESRVPLVAVCLAMALAPGVGAAQPAGGEPAYVVRGRQAEARQREFRNRLARFHATLTERLRRDAPELLAKLEPPPAVATGYQLLPRSVPDAPPKPPPKPQVVSYSWRWSETLIARELATLDRLESDLARLSAQPASADSRHRALETIVTDYKTVIDHRRLIDSDFAYNWHWQAAIARDRTLFDRLTARLDAAVAQQGGAPPPIVEPPAGGFQAPSFVRIEHAAEHEWIVHVPVFTDIEDAAFVQAFESAIESHWRVRDGLDDYRVEVAVEVIPPADLYCGRTGAKAPPGCAPPARGAPLDLARHVALFPKEHAVLTTGATALQLTADRAIVIGPHDIAPRTLAHEFGHVLGFPDAYLRGYRDLAEDAFQILELVPDPVDIMSSPGAGSVTPRHFLALIAQPR